VEKKEKKEKTRSEKAWKGNGRPDQKRPGKEMEKDNPGKCTEQEIKNKGTKEIDR